MVDNANVGELDSDIMLERRMVAEEGLLTVVMTINAYGEIMGEVKVYSRGLVLSPSETKEGFLDKVQELAAKAFEKSPHISHDRNKPSPTIDLAKLQIDIKSELHRYVDDRMHRHPLLEVIIMEYTGKAAALVVGV
jgi:mRNA degradation ribonuclease J1/J2